MTLTTLTTEKQKPPHGGGLEGLLLFGGGLEGLFNSRSDRVVTCSINSLRARKGIKYN